MNVCVYLGKKAVFTIYSLLVNALEKLTCSLVISGTLAFATKNVTLAILF